MPKPSKIGSLYCHKRGHHVLFNVDIWLSDGTNGLRYEDGILVTRTGNRELTSYRQEAIIL